MDSASPLLMEKQSKLIASRFILTPTWGKQWSNGSGEGFKRDIIKTALEWMKEATCSMKNTEIETWEEAHAHEMVAWVISGSRG